MPEAVQLSSSGCHWRLARQCPGATPQQPTPRAVVLASPLANATIPRPHPPPIPTPPPPTPIISVMVTPADILDRSPDVLGGAVVFRGTRVPVQTLMQYLEAGERLDDFLADFPSVTRDQAVAALQLALEKLTEGPDASAA